jgi:3-oxoacyl-[acyl-carrier protein] reductase
MVAGASRGLGFAVARMLAAEGARVSIASRDSEAIRCAVKQIGVAATGNIFGMPVDLRSRSQIEDWHRATVQEFGAVDLLFTNTGGPSAGMTASFDDSAWQEAFESLLLSVIRLVRVVVPGMAPRNKGSIVMLTSSAVKEPIANLALSNVLRASVSALAKTLANELAPSGIRVNQLVPGRIATARVSQLDEINSKRLGIPLAEHQGRARTTIPLGRYGDPDELAQAAVFLLSDASSYITGATLQVDGGLIRAVV